MGCQKPGTTCLQGDCYLNVLLKVFVFLFQDSMNAMVLDLDFPALRKNKNIETFLNRCKYLLLSGHGFLWCCSVLFCW